MKKLMLFITLAAMLPAGFPGAMAQAGCDNDTCMLDFWIGKWDLTWDDGNGATGTGTNEVYKILGGKVVCENFTGLSGKNAGFEGKSWSVYTAPGTWKQTWVDNSSGYLDFTGSREGDRVIFSRKGTAGDGREVRQRMVFYDIAENSFTWDWETSADQGEHWNLRWRISYHRR